MNKKIIFILLGLVSIAFGGYFYYTPYWAVSNMKKAAENRDADTLSEYVDYPSLKESVKANFNAAMATQVSDNMSDNPFMAFGTAMATAFINPMIDNLVTPEGLAMMMNEGKFDIEKTGEENKENSPDIDKSIKTTMSYDNFNTFVVTGKEKNSSDDPIKMIFKRHGIISWKLTALHLPSPERGDKNTRASAEAPKIDITTNEKKILIKNLVWKNLNRYHQLY